ELLGVDQAADAVVVDGHQRFPASCSRYSANRARAAATRSGRNSVGHGPGDGLCCESTAFATVTLCTSVGPSAMPITGATSHIAERGISFEQPSAPWTCSARRTTSCRTSAIETLTAAM